MNPFANATTPTVAGFAPQSISYATVDLPGQRKAKPEEGHQYKVRVDNWFEQNGNTIVEYTVLENDGGGSAPGYVSSVVISHKLRDYLGREAVLAIANMGADRFNPAHLFEARKHIDGCIREAKNKVADASLPMHLIGRSMLVGIYANNPPDPGKKYYPREEFAPCE